VPFVTELQAALQDLAARRPDLTLDVHWHDALPSTMDVVAAAGEQGAPAGYVAIADQQTAGRGRRGHAWASPAGAGLYFSYLTRPSRDVELVTLAAGVGVREGIQASTGVPAHLKWPNDLLIGHRKLAGLLAEGAHLGTSHAFVVIGVGLNVNDAAYPPDVAARAVSLQSQRHREVSRISVFCAVLEHLSDALRMLEQGQAGAILQKWRDASPTAVGTPVSWSRDGAEARGVTAGIDDTGALLIQTDRSLERVIAGEVEWRLT
jgi:BirA family biotin operon repressor/biotin-[acetyl-CoA-carboxylase] ligase